MADVRAWRRIGRRIAWPLRAGYRGFLRLLRVVTRPVRRHRGLEGVVVQPYRGYGTRDEVHLMGRVFHQPGFGRGLPPGSLRRQLADALRRFVRWGLGGAEVTGRLAGGTAHVQTDGDGYFHLDLVPEHEPDRDRLWHEVELEVEAEGTTVRDAGEVFIPPRGARFVVISDIDDTVMYTGVANRLKMMWRLFVQGAESRVAFAGVGALYRGFHRGRGGAEENPMLYVSRAPWSIYEVLARFFQLHRIPVGPILFLREWGLTLQRPWPRRAIDHKRDLIRGMLDRYEDLPFILVGDSGQHDPEIYARIVEENPGRVLAVYIRDVDPAEDRRAEVHRLARRLEEAGSPLILAADSAAMAEHAAREGYIDAQALTEVVGG